jgi:hypothetical protein
MATGERYAHARRRRRPRIELGYIGTRIAVAMLLLGLTLVLAMVVIDRAAVG